MKSLEILNIMLSQPERIYPWQAADISKKMNVPLSTIYRHLKELEKFRLIKKTPGGFLLGRNILESGFKYYQWLSKFGVEDFEKLQEKLYGKLS